jgi:flagellar protein FlgJ
MDINAARIVDATKPAEGFGGKGLLSLTGDAKKSDRQKIETLAKEFESIFLNQALKSMRSTVGDGGLVKKGAGEEMFTSLLDEETARNMAYSPGGGLGLADQLTAQLLSRQDASQPDTRLNASAPTGRY